MNEFWAQLLESVSSFFGLLTQGRRQTFDMAMFGDDLQGMRSDSQAITIGALSDLSSSSPPAPPMWVQAKAQLETLQKADPNFLEANFLTQAAKTFAAMLAAEGAMDASSIAGLVTPHFLQSFQQRIAAWKSDGFTRVVSNVDLDNPTTFKVSLGADVQCITVRFTGNAKRFTRDDMTNLVTDGSAQVESFTEFATYTRPAGSTTPQSSAVSGVTHCPSCGAPITDGALRCSFCGAVISGSGGTWLLDHTSSSAYT